jgi:E3 ubiquitin-protein ligase FANCL
VDAAGRAHLLTVMLPPEYPRAPPVCLADLPAALDLGPWDAAANGSGLAQVQRVFGEAVARYQGLWDVLDAVDARAWVLAGAGARASCTRRLAVAPHCYMQLEVAPLHPRLMPRVTLLGSDRLARPLLAALNAAAHRWDPAAPLVANLERCLDVSLPARPAANAAAESDDALVADACGICYEFHAEEETVPEVVCGNARCGKCFHRLCLYEWLRSIPSTKVSFSAVFGLCPFCEAPVTFRLK